MIARAFRALHAILILSAAAVGLSQSSDVLAEDVFIGHTSTVPVSRGAQVDLFARHYHSDSSEQGSVVVLSSDILPADAGLGLDHENLNYLEHLAEAGFDVFAADMTGYGLSPKPQMGDGCNAADAEQSLLMPYPLYIPCEPSYVRLLTSLASDWDEVATVVEHVVDVTGDEQVALVGWSMGAARAAGYAARNPDVIDRLVLIAPRYKPEAPSEVSSPYPGGRPLRVHEVDAIVEAWRSSVTCENQPDFEAVGAQLRREVNEFDPTAAGWGYELGNVFRSPGIVGLAGFSTSVVSQIDVPTLVIVGSNDDKAAEGQALFAALTVEDKILLNAECGTHWLLWENNSTSIRDGIAEFLKAGTVNGMDSGELVLNREGEYE